MLTVLFEDRHCLVVAKPARLLTASDKTGDTTLLALARAHNVAQQADGKSGYLVPLHFLDRPVSGVVMFAKSSKAAARLSEQLRGHQIDKVYHAIVEAEPSVPRLPEGELNDWLLKNEEQNVVSTAAPKTPGAKACTLHYRLLGRHPQNPRLARLEIRPKTGRSHQIRVQLSSRSMPIYGDVKYGASTGWDGAIALHAASVTFAHPVSKEPVKVEAPFPESWRGLWPADI